MKKEEFITLLEKIGFDFIIKAEQIILSDKNFHVVLVKINGLPEGTMFENEGDLLLNADALKNHPTIRNGIDVWFVSYKKGIRYQQHGITIRFYKY